MQQQGTAEALDVMDRFRRLYAPNVGDFGTLQINHVYEKVLRRKRHSAITGRSVIQMLMITKKKDYDRGLFNGDTGIILQDRERTLTSPDIAMEECIN